MHAIEKKNQISSISDIFQNLKNNPPLKTFCNFILQSQKKDAMYLRFLYGVYGILWAFWGIFACFFRNLWGFNESIFQFSNSFFVM
jgi:hypothetical protein